MSGGERADVLLIGGGFGGMNAARRLDRLLRRKLDANVTLISRTNFYLFTPLLAEVAAALVDSLHAVNPIRRMFKRVRFIQGTVQRRAIAGKPLEPFRYSSKGMLATLGRYRGAGRVFGVPLVGFFAWFAWRTYYLLALPRWERRIRVMIDWTLNLLFPPDIVQIKVERLHPEATADIGVRQRRQEGREAERVDS